MEAFAWPPMRLSFLHVDLGPKSPWGRFVRAYDAVDRGVAELVARRRAEPGGGPDVLSMVLEARDERGEGLGRDELRDALLTLVVAGHDTSASALAWGLLGLLDEFTPPFHSLFGVHTVLPVPGRGVAFVNSEDTSYGKGAAHFAGVVDIGAPERPELILLFPEPIAPEGAPYRSFSERPGWSGPHNVNQLQHNPTVQRQGNLFYIAHFNAGLRVYDVSHPACRARSAGSCRQIRPSASARCRRGRSSLKPKTSSPTGAATSSSPTKIRGFGFYATPAP